MRATGYFQERTLLSNYHMCKGGIGCLHTRHAQDVPVR